MPLPRRTRHQSGLGGIDLIGMRVTTRPPTTRFPIIGTVVAVDRNTLTLHVSSQLLVAVDIEDCRWSASVLTPLAPGYAAPAAAVPT